MLGAMVDSSVEAQFLHEVIDLFRSARNADNAAALDLADLPDCGANRPRRSGHDESFTLFRLPDGEKAAISGQSRHSKNAECGGDWGHVRIELPKPVFVRH